MPTHYDIFLSYSHHDYEVAMELYSKLNAAGLNCFMSEKDIGATFKWEPAVRDALCEAESILILLTPRSKDSSWVMAEVGAAWALEKKLIPALRYVNPSELLEPIKIYQAFFIETSEQQDKLVKSLADPRNTNIKKGFDVFLAAPMAAYKTEKEYQSARSEIMKVYDALNKYCGFNVYCAVAHCSTMKNFDALDVSVIKDLREIKSAKYFVLLYPKKLLSSVLFEAGYALAYHKFSLYYVSDRKKLPYMMQDAASVLPQVFIREMPCSANFDCIVEEISNLKHELFILEKGLP